MRAASRQAHEMMNWPRGNRIACCAEGWVKHHTRLGGSSVAKRHWISLWSLGGALAACMMAVGVTVLHAATDTDTDLLKEAQGFFKPLPKDMATPEFPITPERLALG